MCSCIMVLVDKSILYTVDRVGLELQNVRYQCIIAYFDNYVMDTT